MFQRISIRLECFSDDGELENQEENWRYIGDASNEDVGYEVFAHLSATLALLTRATLYGWDFVEPGSSLEDDLSTRA